MGRTLIACLLIVAGSAYAADPAAEVAARAQAANEQHCATAASASQEEAAALAIVEVSEVWADVARVHEETGADWLLYWRGVLAQCIGQTERAVDALEAFVGSSPGAQGMQALERDAVQRLRRLGIKPPPRPRAAAGQRVAGVSLIAGAVGMGLASAGAWGGFEDARSGLFSRTHTGSTAESLIVQGDASISFGIGLAAGAAVVAVGGAAALGTAPRVALVPVPVPDGVQFALVGAW